MITGKQDGIKEAWTRNNLSLQVARTFQGDI
jgi:hypothetical protein